jgi:methylenetetrahydrofolate dehydrogenase (NADP+)/methenyltetrahydrofolate cyclohydrolase
LSAHLLDGKSLAQSLRARTRSAAEQVAAALGRPPVLTVVLVGQDPASEVYVRNKTRACREAGVDGRLIRLNHDVTEAELLETVSQLNAAPDVDGILVQLPVPPHISERKIIEAIDPWKDVDGFHPVNSGLLAQGLPRFVPCTPLGVIELLKHAAVPLAGAHAVVVGRSNIVGKPMALLLLQKGEGGDATVTICHSATRDLPAVTRQADVLIVAMGRPEAVGPDWVKPGAVVVDVGIHRRSDGSLCGDVQTAAVAEKAAAITPVPGGVGPMTIAMLLQNTVQAASHSVGRS